MGVIFAAIVGFFFAAAIGLALSLPAAWAIMLILGAFHATYPAVPALGFFLTWIGTWGVSLLLSSGNSATVES